MNLRSSILRGFAPAVTALAFVAMGAASANASNLPTYVGIDTAGVTGELSNTGAGGNAPYSGVTGAQAGFTNTTGAGYNFVYAAGSVGGAPGAGNSCGTVATCATSQYGGGSAYGIGFWSVPAGGTGAFLALDSDFNTTGTLSGVAVSQTVTNLIAGDLYTITFGTADAQQNTYTGASQDKVTVCLGAQCFTTNNVLDASASSTPWVNQSFTFSATGTSEALTLLGVGGSNPLGSNVPAFALVDNLAISAPSQAPEPNSLILLGTGLAGLGGLVRSRFVKATVKA